MSKKKNDETRHVPALLPPGGIDLLGKRSGYVIGSRGQALMRFETDKHMVTIANTGGGKGRSVIIPNLLTHNGSAISVEIGGASFKNSVNYRKHVLQQDIHVIDPLHATTKASAQFNVLDTVDPEGVSFVGDMSTIAASILKDSDGDKPQDPYWKHAPRSLLLSLLIYVKTSPSVADEDRHIPYLADIISSYPSPRWHEVMEEMAMDTGKFRAQLNETGNYFYKKETQNTDSITSSVSASLGFAKDPAIRNMLKKSSFNLADLRRNNTTIYIIMPEIEQYTTNAALLRLLLERAFASCPNKGDAGKDFAQHDRVLFLLDEFTQLGKLDIVDMGMQTARQKGITLWTVFQDIGRLEKLYGKEIAGSFLGAAGCVQIFDIGDERTKEYVSQRVGKQIAYIPSVQHGVNWSDSRQESWNETISHGSNHSTTKGTTTGKTESWNETITTGTSNAHGHTNTQGWSDTSSRWSSAMLPYPGAQLTWWEKMQQPSGSGPNRQFGRNSSISESRTVTDSYSKAAANGGSRSDSTQSGTTTGTSTQNAQQNGGGTGHQSGGQYTISYQPQILPRLEPADVELYLGTDNQQIVFLRDGKRVQNFIDFRANWDQIPLLYSHARGPDHIAMPYPQVLPPLLNIAPLDAPTAGMLRDKASEKVSWPARPEWPQIATTCTAQHNFDKNLQPAWWQSLMPAIVRDHIQSTTTQKEIKALACAQKAEDSQFLTDCQNLSAKITAYAQAVENGESILSRRTIQIQRRAGALEREFKNLIIFSSKLDQFRFILSDDHKAGQKLQTETEEYKKSMDTMLEIKKRWTDMSMPARPEALPNKRRALLSDKDVQNLLQTTIHKIPHNICSAAKYSPPDGDYKLPAPYVFDMDGTLRNVQCKVTDRKTDQIYTIAFGKIRMQGSLLSAILGRIGDLFLNKIPERVCETARPLLWGHAGIHLSHYLSHHNQNKAAWAKTCNTLPAKWEARCVKAREQEKFLDDLEEYLNQSALQMAKDRENLEKCYNALCAVNATLDYRRRDTFNKLANWNRWDEATQSLHTIDLPTASRTIDAPIGNDNAPHPTKVKRQRAPKIDMAALANSSYSSSRSPRNPEMK